MAIYVIDDHPLMRDAIVMLVRSLRPGVAVVEAASLAELEAALECQEPPELFCVDLRLPDAQGAEAVRRIRGRCPGVPVVVLSALTHAEAGEECRGAGADVFVEKTLGAAEVQRALRQLLPSGDAACAETDATGPARLSRRQQQLLHLLEQGLSNRDIAERLAISEHTVKVHLWRLFRRLGVKSRTQTVHVARQQGLLRP